MLLLLNHILHRIGVSCSQLWCISSNQITLSEDRVVDVAILELGSCSTDSKKLPRGHILRQFIVALEECITQLLTLWDVSVGGEESVDQLPVNRDHVHRIKRLLVRLASCTWACDLRHVCTRIDDEVVRASIAIRRLEITVTQIDSTCVCTQVAIDLISELVWELCVIPVNTWTGNCII